VLTIFVILQLIEDIFDNELSKHIKFQKSENIEYEIREKVKRSKGRVKAFLE